MTATVPDWFDRWLSERGTEFRAWVLAHPAALDVFRDFLYQGFEDSMGLVKLILRPSCVAWHCEHRDVPVPE